MAGAEVDAADRLMRAALDAGISLVDTADVYGLDWGGSGFGACEDLLGRVFGRDPALRGRVVLARRAASRRRRRTTRAATR